MGMYDLRLDDGTHWLLRSTAETEDWLRRFASIMGLAMMPVRGMPELTLTFHQATGATMRRAPGFRHLPDHEGGLWDFSRLPGVILRGGQAGQDIACLLSRDGGDQTDVEAMRRFLLPLYLDTLRRNGFPVHAALAERDGRAILLAGRGGIGKSTCCRRLPFPWVGLADDLALVIREASGEYRAHPLPTWSAVRSGCGGTWDVGRSVPLDAVFFLDQAGSDEVVPLGEGVAAVGCSQSIMQVLRSVGPFQVVGQNPNTMGLFEKAADFSLAVPAYLLRVSLEGRFWEKIEEALGEAKRKSRVNEQFTFPREIVRGETATAAQSTRANGEHGSSR